MPRTATGKHTITIDIPHDKVQEIAEEQGCLVTHRQAEEFLIDREDALIATLKGSTTTFIGNHIKAWAKSARRGRH